jgi:hypothetical protein
MHNLFLGLIKTHFCGVLGIGSSKRPEDPVVAVNIPSAPADFKSSEKQSLEKLKKWLQAPLPSAMYSNRDQALGKLKSFHARQGRCNLLARNYHVLLLILRNARGQLSFSIGYASSSV